MIEIPQTIHKGWGSETVIHNSSLYCGKVLRVNKGMEGSTHYHMNKTETWLLFSGKLRVQTIDPNAGYPQTVIMYEGEVYHIPAGKVHRMEAIEDSVIFEVSTTHFDNDTYRIAPGDSQKEKVL